MGRGKGHVPVRTCISCGEKRSKPDLLRFVLDGEGYPVVDSSGKAQGRGAYICRSQSCLDRVSKGGRLDRAFRGRKTQSSFFKGDVSIEKINRGISRVKEKHTH